MSEKRYHDHGRFVHASDQNALQAHFIEHGVLNGCTLSVTSDGFLQVASGAVITEDGVVIANDDTREVSFTTQADATIFTVVQLHTFDLQQGGRWSTIELQEIEDDGSPVFSTSVDGGVVLGWIRYPGGSVDLDETMLHSVPKLQTLNPLSLVRSNVSVQGMVPLDYRAPLANSPGVLLVLEDEDVTAVHSIDADGFPVTTIANAHAATTKTCTVYLRPQKDALYTPKYLELDYDSSYASTSVAVSVNVDGTVTLLDTLTGVIAATKQVSVVTDGLFASAPVEAGTEWGVRLVISLPALRSIVFRRARMIAGPVPREE